MQPLAVWQGLPIFPILINDSIIENDASLQPNRLDRKAFSVRYLKHHVPLPFGAHHEDFFENGESTLEAIAAPRGSAKTTFFSLIDVVYSICYRLHPFIILVSETKSLAVERLMDIRAELEGNEKIISDFGSLIGTRWREDDLICSNGVRVTAKGRGGQIRGSKHGARRPSLIILDDVESSENVTSPLQREKVRNWYQTDVRRAGRADGTTKFRVIGTFLHPDALLPQLTENPAYRSKIYKAVLKWSDREDLWSEWTRLYSDLSDMNRERTARKFYESNEAEMLSGVELLWPEGINYYTVMEAIVSDGRYAALKEYQNEMLDPTQFIFPMDRHVKFRSTSDGLLRYVNAGGEGYRPDRLAPWNEIIGASIFLDWSGAKDTINSCFACVVVVLWERSPMSKESYGYIIDCWMERKPLSKQIAACFDLHQKYSEIPTRFECEEFIKDYTGAIHDRVRQMFAEEKQKRADDGMAHDLTLTFRPRHVNKMERITTLEPAIANGWLAFNETLPSDFMQQFEQFPTHQYLDAPDATEGAYTMRMTRKPKKRKILTPEERQQRHEKMRVRL